MTSKFIFSRSDTKNMAAILVSHGALDALCEKNKLLFRHLGHSKTSWTKPDFSISLQENFILTLHLMQMGLLVCINGLIM